MFENDDDNIILELSSDPLIEIITTDTKEKQKNSKNKNKITNKNIIKNKNTIIQNQSSCSITDFLNINKICNETDFIGESKSKNKRIKTVTNNNDNNSNNDISYSYGDNSKNNKILDVNTNLINTLTATKTKTTINSVEINSSELIKINLKYKMKNEIIEMKETETFKKIYDKIDKDYKLKYKNEESNNNNNNTNNYNNNNTNNYSNNKEEIKISKFNSPKGLGFKKGNIYNIVAFNPNRNNSDGFISILINSPDNKQVEYKIKENENFSSFLCNFGEKFTKVIYNGDDVTKKYVSEVLEEGYVIDLF